MKHDHEKLIAVIKAHKEGKTIETRARGRAREEDWWINLNPGFNFESFEYRVKQVMKWSVITEQGETSFVYDSPEEAMEFFAVRRNEVIGLKKGPAN